MLGHQDIMGKPRDILDFGTSADFAEKYKMKKKGSLLLFAQLETSHKEIFIASILLSMFLPRSLAKNRRQLNWEKYFRS